MKWEETRKVRRRNNFVTEHIREPIKENMVCRRPLRTECTGLKTSVPSTTTIHSTSQNLKHSYIVQLSKFKNYLISFQSCCRWPFSKSSTADAIAQRKAIAKPNILFPFTATRQAQASNMVQSFSENQDIFEIVFKYLV